MEKYMQARHNRYLSDQRVTKWYDEVVKELEDIIPIAYSTLPIKNTTWITRDLSAENYGIKIYTPFSKNGDTENCDTIYREKLLPYLKKQGIWCKCSDYQDNIFFISWP